MKKLKGLIIMILISLSLFGMTACGGAKGTSSTYEQITAEQAKTIMDAEKEYIIIDARTEEEFAECKQNGNTAESNEAQSLVKELQAYITKNYYTCTNEILAGLGQMYIADERFKANIDKNGEGTATFISESIATYCRK